MATVGSLAALVGGRVIGDSERQIRDVAGLESAGPADMSFLSHTKYQKLFDETRAGAVLVRDGFEPSTQTTLVVCADPYLALARIASELHPPTSWPADWRRPTTSS